MANTKSIDFSSIHDQTSFAKYKERLEENGFPVFFSLSQIRRTFGIKRDEQEKYFGKINACYTEQGLFQNAMGHFVELTLPLKS